MAILTPEAGQPCISHPVFLLWHLPPYAQGAANLRRLTARSLFVLFIESCSRRPSLRSAWEQCRPTANRRHGVPEIMKRLSPEIATAARPAYRASPNCQAGLKEIIG